MKKLSFEEVMAGAYKIGKQVQAQGFIQLADLKKDPITNAAKIKFLEICLGQEKALIEAM